MTDMRHTARGPWEWTAILDDDAEIVLHALVFGDLNVHTLYMMSIYALGLKGQVKATKDVTKEAKGCYLLPPITM